MNSSRAVPAGGARFSIANFATENCALLFHEGIEPIANVALFLTADSASNLDVSVLAPRRSPLIFQQPVVLSVAHQQDDMIEFGPSRASEHPGSIVNPVFCREQSN